MLKTFILHTRPLKVFDPKLEEHRELFYKFQKTMSWVGCPYLWAIDDDSIDVVHCIGKKMLKYYTTTEFVAKKPRKNPKKNVFKINDLQSQKKVAK